MPSLNCKVELKCKWYNYWVLSAAGNDSANGNDDNIIFTIKDTKLYVPVVTLSARNNQKLTKLLSKGFERSVYWNECKTKSEYKNTTNEYIYFLVLNFVGVNRLFVLVYSNEDNDSKRFKAKWYYLPKGIIKNYVFIVGENFYDKAVDNDIKRCEEIRKLTTRVGEDDTIGCLLACDYIKNHCRVIAVDLNKQKELDGVSKAIQQIELVAQLKNPDHVVVANESMFVSTILEKIKETRLKFSQGSVTVL